MAFAVVFILRIVQSLLRVIYRHLDIKITLRWFMECSLNIINLRLLAIKRTLCNKSHA